MVETHPLSSKTSAMAGENDAIIMQDVSFHWSKTRSFQLQVPKLKIVESKKTLLLGESGSGKTTLLNLICGLYSPSHGKIHVNGCEITLLPPKKRDQFRADNIGIIFQQFNLIPYLPAYDNILLPLHFSPARQRNVLEPHAEVIRLIKALGLDADQVIKSLPQDLSVGQQQRVAAARALIGKPAIIVADEPTSALDSASQERFIDLLLQEINNTNATLLMVSHDNRLESMFDRIINMSNIAQE